MRKLTHERFIQLREAKREGGIRPKKEIPSPLPSRNPEDSGLSFQVLDQRVSGCWSPLQTEVHLIESKSKSVWINGDGKLCNDAIGFKSPEAVRHLVTGQPKSVGNIRYRLLTVDIQDPKHPAISLVEVLHINPPGCFSSF
jgi:hypothetical protein